MPGKKVYRPSTPKIPFVKIAAEVDRLRCFAGIQSTEKQRREYLDIALLVIGYYQWYTGVAYLDDNGNYHTRDRTQGRQSKGPIAKWNRVVKQTHTPDELHTACAHVLEIIVERGSLLK